MKIHYMDLGGETYFHITLNDTGFSTNVDSVDEAKVVSYAQQYTNKILSAYNKAIENVRNKLQKQADKLGAAITVSPEVLAWLVSREMESMSEEWYIVTVNVDGKDKAIILVQVITERKRENWSIFNVPINQLVIKPKQVLEQVEVEQ